MGSSNKIVLSYGDSLLREADVELLEGPYWLNDNVISFYFEYLTRSVFKHRRDMLFVSPEVTHCLKAAKLEEIPIFLDPLNAKGMAYVLFAFNDHKMFERSGGTHWSLLAYCEQNTCMYHFDSMSGLNFLQAAKVSSKLLQYLTPLDTKDFKELPSPQQDNGYDCGIFVLALAQFLMEKCENGYSLEECPMMSRNEVNAKRAEVLNLVTKLAKG